MPERRDPYRGFNFRVAIGGRGRTGDGYSEVRLPTLLARPDVGPEAAVAGLGDEYSSHLVLTRGYTGATDLREWWLHERQSMVSRGRVVVVELLDDAGGKPVLVWRFTACRPVALHYSALDALQTSVLTETIVLSYEGVELS